MIDFLDEVAAPQPVPAGGSVAAAVVAMAAALLVKASALSRDQWSEAIEAGGRAEEIRLRAGELIEADAKAYRALQAARRAARGLAGDDEHHRIVGPAASLAVDVPLAVARFAGEVATLARKMVERGNPHLREDAAMAGLLAAAAAQGSALMVAVNLDHGVGDPRLAEARALAQGAAAVAAGLSAGR